MLPHAQSACAVVALILAAQSNAVPIRCPSVAAGQPASGKAAPSAFHAAFDRVVAESADPIQTRDSLLARLQISNSCYRGDMTEAEFQELLQRTLLLPPTMSQFDVRYFQDIWVWNGDGGQGQSNTSRRANLTFSFPADGVTWGLACGATNSVAPNTLGHDLQFGFTPAPQPLDRGREYIRSAFAAWRKVTGLTYQEVPDNGESMNTNYTHSAARGDIRIGGFATGTQSGILAWNAFPSNQGFTSCSGGDMCINTSYFTASYFNLSIAKYLYFRNTVAHEHGHGLGLKHVVPCDETKLMEPIINTTVDLIAPDDVRAGIANYGDRYAGNHTFANAKDFGTLAGRSVLERDLGLNGRMVNIGGGQTVNQDDYYRFTLSGTQSVTMSVTPTGLAGNQGQQSTGCNGGSAFVDGASAGHLQIQLLNTSQQVIASALSAPPGAVQALTQSLGAGTYTMRVWDQGDASQPNSTASAQRAQVYNLLIRVGTNLAPPRAIAGVNKLATAGAVTYFMGDLNSSANEDGATIPATGYEWDLDGDSSFETVGVGQPTITYLSNGTYNVTLRVTDSNGLTATDTIACAVTGATTSLTAPSPASGNQGTTVPVVLNGTNLKLITMLSQIAVSGTGVTVSGSPVPNGLGTQINGLSLVINGAASTGARNITITGADGAGSTYTGNNLFTVTAVSQQGACCASDGGCTIQTQSACQAAGGSYLGNGTACSPNPCPQPSACCFANGSCLPHLPATCLSMGGSSMSGACNPCPQPTGACCAADGTCSTQTQAVCQALSRVYQGNDSLCSPNPCPQPTGACCAADGTCSTKTQSACQALSRVYQGDNSSCVPNPCPQPTGACCAGTTCSVTTQAACAGAFRRFVGIGAACNSAGNATTPCCKADFNQSSPTGVGGVTIQDLYDYLSAYFAQNSIADFNANGSVSTQDLFDYMKVWFSGCGSTQTATRPVSEPTVR